MNLLLCLLQAVPAQAAATTAAVPPPADASMLGLVLKGGWILLPIFLMSLYAVYLMVAKGMMLSKAVSGEVPMFQLVQSIESGKIDSAVALCQASQSLSDKVLLAGLTRLGRPMADIEKAMENEARQQIDAVSNNVHYLGIISSVAPMCGFLGTIFGIIRIFYDISIESNISIGAISEGLYQKMVASSAGLLVGMIAYIGYHMVNSRVDKLGNRVEARANQLLDVLKS